MWELNQLIKIPCIYKFTWSVKHDCDNCLFLDYSYYYSGYYQAAAEPMLNTATEIQDTSDMYAATTETATASLPQSDEVTNVADTQVKGVYVYCADTVSDFDDAW